MKFRTHTGEIIEGERLQIALNAVADDWRDIALRIHESGDYASHVTQERKDANLERDLAFAEEIRNGGRFGFTIWQRVNTKLTGECVGFLRGS